MKPLMLKLPALYQLARYGIVGILNNLLGYLIYLIITFFLLDPKIAISLFYPIGAVTGYLGHMKYSFTYHGKNTNAWGRYFFTYLIGYVINLMMLWILSDIFHFPHQAVQALAIFIVAGVLFFMLKYFVFPPVSNNLTLKASHETVSRM